MHSGGGLNARAAMAWPPYQSPARAKPEASDLLIGNPSGHRSTPLSAGRLRMPLLSDFMVHLAHAVGKCQNQVPYSCAIGNTTETGSTWPFLAHAPRKLPVGRWGRIDLQCRKSAARRFADASWALCSGLSVKSRA